MVDDDRASVRLRRLEELVDSLEEIREKGEEAYLSDSGLRAMAERWLELAIQICIDLGTQVLAEHPGPTPAKYAEVFEIFGRQGSLPKELADRLAEAAKQRNVLVHLYLEIDDKKVFKSFSHLDDLRQFGAFVGEQLD
ncbi:MAG: type VII toxin-antitoxin system HepT family RNase toxin [Solirubrobacterales bacterium]